jgi:carboxymethylenebutenolidase
MDELIADWLTLHTADGPMNVYRVRPRVGPHPRCAVIVLQEAFGVNGHIQDVARRIAAEGYVAVAPDLFHRTGIGEVDYADRDTAIRLIGSIGPDQIDTDLAPVLTYLQNEEKASQIGVVGFCFGGRAAFTAATLFTGLAGTVVFYGPGIAAGPHAVLERVSNITGRVLMIVGDIDPTIPMDHVAAIRLACDHSGVDLRLELFGGVGHAFHCDARPAMYREDAARQAWRNAVDFLATTVAQGVP